MGAPHGPNLKVEQDRASRQTSDRAVYIVSVHANVRVQTKWNPHRKLHQNGVTI